MSGAAEPSAQALTLGTVYGEHAGFVWRALLRLGAAPDVAEALQMPLIQVHTRLRSARNLFRAALAGRGAATAKKESA